MSDPSIPGAPTVKVRLARDGAPLGAAASVRIEHSPEVVWSAVADIERYARHLPMVHRARRDGDDVAFDLRFKVGFLSAGFSFRARATYEEGRWLELRWLEGEPRDIRLRFTLTPTDDGACLVEGDGEFDLMSLGWLAKYFLRHHPEIQFGIFPGVALVLIDSLRRAADEVAKG